MREKEEPLQQFAHDKELLASELKQRMIEFERSADQQEQLRLKTNLMQGLDDPAKAIEGLKVLNERLRVEAASTIWRNPSTCGYCLCWSESNQSLKYMRMMSQNE